MCGLMTGNVKKLKDNGGIKEHLRIIDHRGTDSYGMVTYNPKTQKWDTFKTLALKQFVKKFNALSNDTYAIIHNRARSIGGITLPLAHPITTNKVAVMHNGTNKAVHTMINGASSDTEAISMMQGNAVDFSTTFDWLDDLGVVFTVDLESPDKDIHLHRDKIRPLVLHEGTHIIASEPLFDGRWADIKEQDTYVPLHFNKITNMVINNEFVDVEVFNEDMCVKCKKRHLHSQNGKVCNVCSVRGLEAPAVSPVVYTTTNTSIDNIREERELEKQMQVIHNYVMIENGPMMHKTVFDNLPIERRKVLIGFADPQISSREWLRDKLDVVDMIATIPKGEKLHWLVKDYDELDTQVVSTTVFGYAVRSKLGTWFVVEDTDHNVELSSWYRVYAKEASTKLKIETDGYAYSEDNFAEYLHGDGKDIMVDMTNTYVIEADTLVYWTNIDPDNNLVSFPNGDLLIPMLYTW